MKIYKYFIVVRNLLDYLKENLDKETWEKVRSVLKEKKYKIKCKKCGKVCSKYRENYYLCEECGILYYIEEGINYDIN